MKKRVTRRNEKTDGNKNLGLIHAGGKRLPTCRSRQQHVENQRPSIAGQVWSTTAVASKTSRDRDVSTRCMKRESDAQRPCRRRPRTRRHAGRANTSSSKLRGLKQRPPTPSIPVSGCLGGCSRQRLDWPRDDLDV